MIFVRDANIRYFSIISYQTTMIVTSFMIISFSTTKKSTISLPRGPIWPASTPKIMQNTIMPITFVPSL